MGYYIEDINGEITIPKDKHERALKRFKALAEYPQIKSGGSFSGGGCKDKWFSWMKNEVFETGTLSDIIEEMGFLDVETQENGDLCFSGYDTKQGQERLFIGALHGIATGKITFRGECGGIFEVSPSKTTFDYEIKTWWGYNAQEKYKKDYKALGKIVDNVEEIIKVVEAI